jgi:uncharacterized protein
LVDEGTGRRFTAVPHPGVHVLARSAPQESFELRRVRWSTTGRIVRLTMYPLDGRECHGDHRTSSLIDRLSAEGVDTFTPPPRTTGTCTGMTS